MSCKCLGQRHTNDWTEAAVSPVRGAQEEGASGQRDAVSRLHGLQRENVRLQEQLRSSEELNATLRSELDLHRSIMAQTSFHQQELNQNHDQEGSGPQMEAQEQDADIKFDNNAAEPPRTVNLGK